jgi:hypothetical protein
MTGMVTRPPARRVTQLTHWAQRSPFCTTTAKATVKTTLASAANAAQYPARRSKVRVMAATTHS